MEQRFSMRKILTQDMTFRNACVINIEDVDHRYMKRSVRVMKSKDGNYELHLFQGIAFKGDFDDVINYIKSRNLL